MSTSLCLLTLNELAGCQRDVPQLPRPEFDQVFAIDGGSTDGTVEYLQSQGIEVARQQRPGLNGACWDGIEHCRSEFLIFFHPKGTTPPADTLKLKQALEAGNDLVVAGRNVADGRNEEDAQFLKPRKWFVALLAWLAAARWRREGPVIRDVLHGFRGVRKSAFLAMNPPQTGFTIDLALVVAAYRHRRKRGEVPTIETPRLQGETHFRAVPTGARLLGYLLRESLTPCAWLALIAVATAVGHLAFGAWYWNQWTRQNVATAGPPLNLTGAAYLQAFPGFGKFPERDANAYIRAALSILDTGIPRMLDGVVYWRAPIYPYFLAACYRLGDLRQLSVIVPQALLAGLTCFLVGLAAGRLATVNRGTAMIVASGLFAVNLRFAMYVGYIYPTVLLMLCAAIVMLTPQQPGRIAVAMLFGLFSQAAFFVIAGAAGLWLLFQRNRAALVAGLIVLSVVGVKVVANTRATDAQAKWDRGILWEANNPAYADMGWRDLWAQRRAPLPAEADPQQAAREWISQHPGQYAKLCFVRLRAALGPFTGDMSGRNRLVALTLWLLVFPAAAIWLWQHRARPEAQLVLFCYAGYAVFAALVIEDWYLRYRIPLEVMLTVMAGVAIADLSAGTERKRA